MTRREFSEKALYKMNPIVRKYITDAVEKLNYQLIPVNADDDLYQLSNGDVSIPYIMGYVPINNSLGSALTVNKSLSYQVLAKEDIKVPATAALQNLFDKEGEPQTGITQLLAQLQFPLFLKPENGSQGIGIALAEDVAQLLSHLKLWQKKYPAFLAQEFINAPEYRILMLDGKPRFVYRRIPGKVCGDGKSTLTELVTKLKQSTDLDLNFGINRSYIFEQLLQLDADWQSVIPEGVEIKLSPGVSLKSGRSFSHLVFTFPSSWNTWLSKINRAINSRLYAIDFFMCGDYSNPDDFVVIEINSNPRFTFLERTPHRDVAVAIWAEILEKSFERFK